MRHKIENTGATYYVKPFPPANVFAAAPAEIHEAHAALKETNVEAKAADRAVVEASKAARAEDTPSERVALEDEVHAKEKERDRLKRGARSAAHRLTALLDEHREQMIEDGARLDVERHVRVCDVYADLVEASGGAGRRTLRQPHALASWVNPDAQARPDLDGLGRYLDETNVEGLLERAGMTPGGAGLVRVVKTAQPFIRFLTTPKRAALLPSSEYTIEEV